MSRGTWTRGLVCLVALAVALSAAPAWGSSPEDTSRAGDVVPGAYIVTLRAGADTADVVADARGRAHRVDVGPRYTAVLNGFAARMPDTAARHLAADSRVLRVEPDRYVSIAASQSSPPWGLDRIDQRTLPLSTTYDYNTTGAGVRTYVVDTGVRATHTELAGRVVPGFDAVSGSTTDDCHGHGTHVAGTLAGTTYGVAKAATVVPVRVLDCNGEGSIAGVVAGIDWITENHLSGTPAVANLSLGTPGFFGTLDTAINNSVTAGVTYVVAAGNDNRDACEYAPASTKAAITVGATTESDAKASFSNYGSCVDVFAPGKGVTSAVHTSDTATKTWSGTSMAAPHVAGVAARHLQRNPTATPAEVHSALIATASTGVTSAGTGSPDALIYVDSLPADTAPPQMAEFVLTPASIDVSTTSQQVTVEMDITDDIAGIRPPSVTLTNGSTGQTTASVTAQLVTGTPNDGTYRAVIPVPSRSEPGTWTATVSPLEDLGGNRADAAGPGDDFANTLTVIRNDAPGQPRSVSAQPGDGTATVQWAAPLSDGGSPITGYRVTSSGGHTALAGGSASSAVVTGLTNGVSYRFTVRAINAVGVGPASDPSASVTPTAADTTPPTVTLTAPAARVKLSPRFTVAWEAGDAGSGVRSSSVRWRRARADTGFSGWVYPSAWQNTTATRVTLSGVPLGYTYCFSVRARDGAGNQSGWSRQRCSTRPMDDRATVRSAGWGQGTGTAYYATTHRTTQRRGATLRTGPVRTRHVSLVATTCPRCGRVTVLLGGKVIRRVDLARSSLRRRTVIPVATYRSARRGRVVLHVTSSNRRVQIDGLAVAR